MKKQNRKIKTTKADETIKKITILDKWRQQELPVTKAEKN